MLSAAYIKEISARLAQATGKKVVNMRVTQLSGGSINHACRLDTSFGKYFLKTNNSYDFPEMFEKEIRGLEELRKSGAVRIPELITTGTIGEDSYLILEYKAPGNRKPDFDEEFGRSLSKLHEVRGEKYGFGEDNYIGSLVQYNREQANWVDFFREHRLEAQLKMATGRGRLSQAEYRPLFDALYKKLDDLLPEEKPSLLHGDLWNGNVITGPDGYAWLIDPAVYYGHREMDLAMTKLFGGFGEGFYSSYNETHPLLPGFEERTDIYNLYPLMVHVNLFGGSYERQVREILRRFK